MTLIYYFFTTGMAILLLIALTIIIDILSPEKWLRFLIDNGLNPMIAYIVFANLLGDWRHLRGDSQVVPEVWAAVCQANQTLPSATSAINSTLSRWCSPSTVGSITYAGL